MHPTKGTRPASPKHSGAAGARADRPTSRSSLFRDIFCCRERSRIATETAWDGPRSLPGNGQYLKAARGPPVRFPAGTGFRGPTCRIPKASRRFSDTRPVLTPDSPSLRKHADRKRRPARSRFRKPAISIQRASLSASARSATKVRQATKPRRTARTSPPPLDKGLRKTNSTTTTAPPSASG